MFSLESFIAAAKEKNLHMSAVMVVQNDTILGLHRFSDVIFHNVFSVAKSHTATAIGFAIDEGLLHLHDKPTEMFADILPPDADPRWQEVTLYHLLTMTSGHGQPYLMAAERKKLRGETQEAFSGEFQKEWLRFAFSRPMVYEVGKKFSYGNLAPYVAGRMLEKAVGMSIRDYLYEKFWGPIGMDKPQWDADFKGHTFAASDLYLDIVDMVKLGELYAGGGVYRGKRFLSEEWIKTAGSCHVASSHINPAGNAIDEEEGYGFYFWINHGAENSYRCYGREGQFVIILPEKNAVIGVQAMNSDVQPLIDTVWEEILPQL